MPDTTATRGRRWRAVLERARAVAAAALATTGRRGPVGAQLLGAAAAETGLVMTAGLGVGLMVGGLVLVTAGALAEAGRL